MWKITGRTLLTVCLSLIFLSSVAIAQINVRPIGTYASGLFDESAAEIVVHDPNTQRLYVVNANSGNIDVLDINNPATPTLFSRSTQHPMEMAQTVSLSIDLKTEPFIFRFSTDFRHKVRIQTIYL